MSDILAPVLRDIDAALQQHGLRRREILLISPLQERKGARFAYRAQLDDGRTVKVRHFGNSDAAQRIVDLRADLEEAFAPAIACYGPVLIEAWIDGDMLDPGNAEAWAAEAGALLGRLHMRPLAVSTPPESTRTWLDHAQTDLGLLRHAAAIGPDEATTMHASLRQLDPRTAQAVLIHKDFCAENMLIDRHGKLRIIDNERLSIEPAGFDLGWTYHRWPMSRSAWGSFCRGYESSGATEPAALRFWKIIAALTCTRVFLQHMPERLPASLAALRRVVADTDASGPI